jgi:uncharacterized protein
MLFPRETVPDIIPYHFIDEIKALPFVEAIYLYGSRARGDDSPRSDIDLAIVCPDATEQDWFTVLDIVENADTLLEIDCVRFDELADGNQMKETIDKQKIILYRKGETSHE